MDYLSPACRIAWMIAAAESEAQNRANIGVDALAIGLCKIFDVPLAEWLKQLELSAAETVPAMTEVELLARILREHGVDPVKLRRRLRAYLGEDSAATPAGEKRVLHRSTRCHQVFERARQLARGGSASRVELRHLLLAVLMDGQSRTCTLMAEARVDLDRLQNALGERSAQSGQSAQSAQSQATEGSEPAKQSASQPAPHQANQSRSRGRTPSLDQFGRDVTQLAREGKLPPVIGRKAEMTRIAQVLCRQRKNNPILVGEAGVGKTCIVEGLAQRLVQPDAPASLVGKRIVELSMATLVAGTGIHGQFEERLQKILEEARENVDVVLFIDEIHTMVGAGSAGRGAMDAANILKPALARGEIRCIGATTTSEYRRYIEKDEALARRFEMVWVEEPTRDEAIGILQGLRPSLEKHHGLSITDRAIAASVDLSIRYLPDLRLPDKCLDLIDQACAQKKLATLSVARIPVTANGGPAPLEREPVDFDDVALVVAQRCRVPLERMTVGDQERLAHLAEALGRRVIGQEQAVQAVTQAVLASRAGLADPRRPQGVFLFLGPTGVGKTELARALAEFLFDDENRLIRFDMSEFMEKHTVARLIGAPPGYVGYEEEGQLTGKIRSQPYSVVLFDEVEKAHPEVLNLFLQLFDDGRLTDAKGRRADFRNAIIIMTSNLGAVTAQVQKRPIGFAAATPGDASPEKPDRREYEQNLLAAARQALAPELYNRIRNVVPFYPITPENLRRIIDKLLDRVRQRLSEKGLTLVITESAYDVLMRSSHTETGGVRQMERVIEDQIVAPVAAAVLANRFPAGTQVVVRTEGDGLTLASDGE